MGKSGKTSRTTRADAEPPSPGVLTDVDTLLDEGDVDGALCRRRELREFALAGSPDEVENARARAQAAEFDLIHFDVDGARAALKPYFGTRHNRLKPFSRLEERRGGRLAAARLLSVQGNLLYRQHLPEPAHEMTQAAHEGFLDLLSKPHAHEPCLWNLAFCARNSWAAGLEGLADGYLRACVKELGHPVIRSHPPPRTHSVEAFTLDLWANLDWARGRHEDAQRRIYRALFLLRGQLQDSIRLGYALFSAGRIESTYSSEQGLRIADELLDEALARLQGHPVHGNALVAKAQLLVKANEPRKALKFLEKVPTDKDRRIAAEVLLVQAWVHLRGSGAKATQQAIDATRAILAEDSYLPVRVRAESRVHLGRALCRAREFDEGVAMLREGLELANKFARRKIEALASLELARTYSDQDQLGEARLLWEHAVELLTHARSSYLENLRDEIAQLLKTGWVHVVTEDRYDAAVEAFRQRYITRAYLANDRDIDKTANATGVARATVTGHLPLQYRVRARKKRK